MIGTNITSNVETEKIDDMMRIIIFVNVKTFATETNIIKKFYKENTLKNERNYGNKRQKNQTLKFNKLQGIIRLRIEQN